MKPAMRMLAMERLRGGDEPPRSEYGGDQRRRMIGYDRDGGHERRTPGPGMTYGGYDPPEDRYGGGRHLPPMDRYDDEPEARRRRDRRGRFASGSYGGGDDDEDEYRPRAMYGSPRPGNSYGDIYAEGTIYAPGAMNRPMGGMHGGRDEMSEPVDERQAMEWVHRMTQPEGGRPMPAFKPEEADSLRRTICPECDKWEFFVTMNMKYSDEFETARKFGQDRPEFYASLAKGFLTDRDAAPHKLRRYMATIPKK